MNMSDVSPAFKKMCEQADEALKISAEKTAMADRLLAEAKVNDAYAMEMRQCGGAERSPLTYAAHLAAAARKRSQAAKLMEWTWGPEKAQC